ncbi:MAG TPA: ATP-dependent Clp protease ATP-binding subunit ClpC, partial [Terracidiphilus sp.]|nr:ATP-dependent Clp protease ATP-binding subunit ClpC [Terracidiphilus sp.]
ETLKERGIELKTVREDLAKAPHHAEETRAGDAPDATQIRDLTRAALEGQLEPVLGRDLEIEAVIDILSRFRNGNPVLVGEPGSGKTSIVEGVAQRIADGSAPQQLKGKRVVAFDRFLAGSQATGRAGPRIADESGTIVFVGDLRSLPGVGMGFGFERAGVSVRPSPLQGQIRCIATSTEGDYKECLHAAPWLRDVFRAVFIHPLDSQQTLSILEARKAKYEAFHEVSYSEEALQCAVESADRYLPHHALPGKALELLDAAAVRLKRQQPTPPDEVMEINKRIQFIAQRLDSAIVNHESEKAKFYGDEEKKERENLRAVRDKHQVGETGGIVVRGEDIEAMIASWSRYPFQP